MSFFFSFPCPPVLQGLSNDADLTSLWPNPWPNLTEIWDFLQNYPHIFLLFGYPIIRTHVSFISSLHLDPPFSEFSQGKSALSIPPKYHYYLKFKFWVHIGYLFYCSWDMSVISFHVRTNIIIIYFQSIRFLALWDIAHPVLTWQVLLPLRNTHHQLPFLFQIILGNERTTLARMHLFLLYYWYFRVKF